MEAPPPAPSPRSPEAAAPSASSASPPAAAAEPPDDAIAHASSPPLPPPSLAAAPPLKPACAPPPAPPEAPLTPPLAIAAAVPPETHFASREQLLAHVHAFSLRQGYAVVIQKSNVPRGQLWLRCDLGGSYRSASSSSAGAGGGGAGESRKRKSASRLQNCPFQLYARRLPDARWLLKVQNAAHNHEVDPEQLVTHPAARRLTLAQKQLVDELTSVGARPAHIVEKLKEQFPDKPVKVQDIYNARNYIRRERGAGRVPFSQTHGQDDDDDGDDDADADAAPAEAESSQPQADAPLVASGAAAPVESPPAAPVPAPSSAARSSSSGGSSSTAEQLQTLLRGASAQFAAWQPRTQKQFLFQLEALLARCSKSESARAASPGAGSRPPGATSSSDDASASETTSSAVATASAGGGEASSPSAAATPPLL